MDSREKSFDTAIGTSKLMITLSTAVLAFCVAIVNVQSGVQTIFTPDVISQKVMLTIIFAFLIGSIAMGAWMQLGVTHILSVATHEAPPDIWSVKIRVPFMFQFCLFILGMAILAGYGVWKLYG
tara:strand:+ start:2733 stop:3104 length:372 start_codon:yes stop_codon:yes gene_type:complete